LYVDGARIAAIRALPDLKVRPASAGARLPIDV